MDPSKVTVIGKMQWTAAHADHVRTGAQARRWLLVLARRMRAVEEARTLSPAEHLYAHAEAIPLAFDEGKRVARRFLAPDPPPHLLELRAYAKNPYRPWEWVSWWSGMAKYSHVWGGARPRGRRNPPSLRQSLTDDFKNVVSAFRARILGRKA